LIALALRSDAVPEPDASQEGIVALKTVLAQPDVATTADTLLAALLASISQTLEDLKSKF
jgi:hypothetical protein